MKKGELSEALHQPRPYIHSVWTRSDLLCACGMNSLGTVAECYDSRLAEVVGRITKGNLPNPDAGREFLNGQPKNWHIESEAGVPI